MRQAHGIASRLSLPSHASNLAWGSGKIGTHRQTFPDWIRVFACSLCSNHSLHQFTSLHHKEKKPKLRDGTVQPCHIPVFYACRLGSLAYANACSGQVKSLLQQCLMTDSPPTVEQTTTLSQIRLAPWPISFPSAILQSSRLRFVVFPTNFHHCSSSSSHPKP